VKLNERDNKQLPAIVYVKEPLNSKHNQDNPAVLVLFTINKVLQCQNLQSSADRWFQCEAPYISVNPLARNCVNWSLDTGGFDGIKNKKPASNPMSSLCLRLLLPSFLESCCLGHHHLLSAVTV